MLSSDKVFIYDTTLRDGSQKKGISYTLEDKIAIIKKLNDFGIDYIEGGWPGSNPKDKEFFDSLRTLNLNSKVVAFGSTRRKNIDIKTDMNIEMLLSAGTPVVAIVGKSWTLHVEKVLETTLEENIRMIEESVHYCKSFGKEVVYDAEHFFDGYINDPNYTLETLKAAVRGGADWIILCDTNGGTMTDALGDIVSKVIDYIPIKVGIHAHNDCELAVANSIEAVRKGARQVQGTVNGYGERCGNANLISIIPNLQIKMGYDCVDSGQLRNLLKLSTFVSEKANLVHDAFQPYVGSAAFAHKGGIHVAAVEKSSLTYEHIEPSTVGNSREIIVSELSGRGNMRMLSEEWGLDSQKNKVEDFESRVLRIIKLKEQNGYQYEGAEGSVELIMRKLDPTYLIPFFVTDYIVVSERRTKCETGTDPRDQEVLLEGVQAIVKLDCNGTQVHTAAEGQGPVHALDLAMRKALLPFYPSLECVKLIDYKVRILDPKSATSAIARVVLEAGNGTDRWSTVGCGRNLVSASFQALIDSFEIAILKIGLPSFAKIKVNQ
jgi:2-isopropylmalate synthase